MQLKLEEGFRLAIEVIHRAEEEYLVLKDKEARLKSEAEDQARLTAEEEASIAEELRLRSEAKDRASLKAEEEAISY